jgi:UDPglucose--hexose-1-phosphate uridylyltransferase
VSRAAPAGQHRRHDPLTGRWVLVSPHRNARPWHGALAAPAAAPAPRHDPACHLCPGNLRANGARNPDYRAVHVFDNDFPALRVTPPQQPAPSADPPALFASEAVRGTCRVVCYSPDHDRTMSRLTAGEIRAVIDCWCREAAALGTTHRWVQVFENKGETMGCSNPHPHGQLWASDHLPGEPALEDARQRDYLARHGTPLLAAVAAAEAGGERQVVANAHWLAIVPWWATWPFETLLLPRFPVRRLDELDAGARDALAAALRELTRRYDALFGCDFPYSMGWHGAPYGAADAAPAADAAHWTLHAHFYPPLLRSATVRKFMVGYEMLAEPQRDLTAEQAAARLRELVVAD